MQITSTTDYTLRIVCYLARQREIVSAAELSRNLCIPVSYIPKITKVLKNAKMITALEGTKGGYMLAKKAEDISLKDVITCTESTMKICKCMEKDKQFFDGNHDCYKVREILYELQNTIDDQLQKVSISDIID